MQLIHLTIESVRLQLDQPTPELYLVIAKHLVLGMDVDSIASVLCVDSEEIDLVLEDEEFKQVRALVNTVYAEANISADVSWDGIEQQALKNLAKTVEFNQNPDLNLRIAAIANKASRRHRGFSKPLDAGETGRIVKIRLTERMIRRLTAPESQGQLPSSTMNGAAPAIPPVDGMGSEVERSMEVVVEREIAVSHKSTTPPTFAEVDRFLGVSSKRANDVITSGNETLSMDSLIKGMEDRGH